MPDPIPDPFEVPESARARLPGRPATPDPAEVGEPAVPPTTGSAAERGAVTTVDSPAAPGSPASPADDERAPLPMAVPASPPFVIETREDYLDAVAALRAGHGPVAVDAERASGFRYSQRAYLIQVFRRGSGTFLFDPPAVGDFSELQEAIGGEEWVLHAASQDLPCLRELDLEPRSLFDTELGARLAGLPRVGLGAVVEETLGLHLAKEHSAADWSTRPLPASWLTYAALDVELLVDVRDAIAARLEADGKSGARRRGVRRGALPLGSRAARPSPGAASPACTPCAGSAPWRSPASSGSRATPTRARSTPRRAVCSPTPRSSSPPAPRRRASASSRRCRASTGGRAARSSTAGGPPSRPAAPPPICRCCARVRRPSRPRGRGPTATPRPTDG